MSVDRIVKMLDSILTSFKEKEMEINYDISYYSHNEFNGCNMTHFETLSNLRLIGIQSKLDLPDITCLMNIFQSIFDKNLDIYNDIDHFLTSFDEDEEEYDEAFVEKLKNYDPEAWITALKKQYNNFTSTGVPLEKLATSYAQRGKIFEPLNFSNQRYFTISDIIRLLRTVYSSYF